MPVEAIDFGLGGPGLPVDAADPGELAQRSLLAHHEPPVETEHHAVRRVRARPEHRDPFQLEREPQAVERKPLDVDLRRAGLATARNRREVERVLIRGIDGALVGVRVDDLYERRRVAEQVLEAPVVGDERLERDRGHGA